MYQRQPSTGITRYGNRRRGVGDVEAGSAVDIVTRHLAALKALATGGGGTLPSGHNPNVTASGGTTSATITAADFVMKNGVCKPTNFIALETIKRLQRGLNRVATKAGQSPIVVDGDLGNSTLALLGAVQRSPRSNVMGEPERGCIGVAPDADVIADQVEVFADEIGAPKVASGVPKSPRPPSIIDPKTQAIVPQGTGANISDALKGMPTIMKLGFVGILGGIGYFAFFDKKGKR